MVKDKLSNVFLNKKGCLTDSLTLSHINPRKNMKKTITLTSLSLLLGSIVCSALAIAETVRSDESVKIDWTTVKH